MRRHLLSGLLALIIPLSAPAAHATEYLPVILHNTCKYKVQVFVRHLPPPGTWVNSGWWLIQPNQMTKIALDGEPIIHDSSQPLFYYGTIPNTRYSWNDPQGRITTRYKGNSYALKRNATPEDGPDDAVTIRFNCNNFKG